MTKYGAKKTIVDGIEFDSRLEATRYTQLRLMERAEEISDLKLQVEFQVIQGWINPDTGEKIRGSIYIADFMYCDKQSHQVIVEDTKGKETDDFRLKWKLAQSLYPQYTFRKLTKDDI